MQQSSARKATVKAVRIDRRPAILATAVSMLASLFIAYQLFF